MLSDALDLSHCPELEAIRDEYQSLSAERADPYSREPLDQWTLNYLDELESDLDQVPDYVTQIMLAVNAPDNWEIVDINGETFAYNPYTPSNPDQQELPL